MAITVLRFAKVNKNPTGCIPLGERVEKFATLLDGNAARSKIKDFRTALLTLAVPKENYRLGREFSLTAAP